MGHKILENNVPVGTWGNKYDTKNPIKKRLLHRFLNAIVQTVASVKDEITTIHEIGCGEGYVTRLIHNTFPKLKIRGTDYAEDIVSIARQESGSESIDFGVSDIYKLDPQKDSADLVMCCEVMEHLDYPKKALQTIRTLNAKYYLFSVPCEPMWRIMQFFSGNNILSLGNTPGHINHWSPATFGQLISSEFTIVTQKTILPWIIVLAKKK